MPHLEYADSFFIITGGLNTAERCGGSIGFRPGIFASIIRFHYEKRRMKARTAARI